MKESGGESVREGVLDDGKIVVMHPDVAKRARHMYPHLSERIIGSAIIENEETAYVIDLDALYDPIWKVKPEFVTFDHPRFGTVLR